MQACRARHRRRFVPRDFTISHRTVSPLTLRTERASDIIPPAGPSISILVREETSSLAGQVCMASLSQISSPCTNGIGSHSPFLCSALALFCPWVSHPLDPLPIVTSSILAKVGVQTLIQGMYLSAGLSWPCPESLACSVPLCLSLLFLFPLSPHWTSVDPSMCVSQRPRCYPLSHLRPALSYERHPAARRHLRECSGRGATCPARYGEGRYAALPPFPSSHPIFNCIRLFHSWPAAVYITSLDCQLRTRQSEKLILTFPFRVR